MFSPTSCHPRRLERPAATLALLAVLSAPACRPPTEPTPVSGGSGGSAPAVGAPQGLRFVERSPVCGIDFVAVCGGVEKDWILEVNGAGCALFDYDGDGDLDVYIVNGARFPDDAAAQGEPPSDALYRNDGGWRFVDVTDAAGVREEAWGCGVCVADVENDGDLDVFVTNYGPDRLWRNEGDGTFRDVTDEAGVGDPGWGSSAAFLDYDRDGLIDLFVVNYLEFDRAKAKPRGPDSCDYKGQKILCGPVGFPRGRCTLYRNRGEGRFEDVSEPAGIAAKTAYGLGVATGDFDSDGWLDIYVASDTTSNLLFRNRGDGTFEEVGLQAGVALNDQAVAQAGMGVEFAFVGASGREDLFVANYEDDTNTYYRNDGGGFFTEVTSPVGLGAPSFKHLGWSSLFVDLDLDADLDLFVAQGHVVPQADAIPSSPGYRQRNALYLNDGDGRFREVAADCGSGMALERSSRGAAAGDLDGDGDLDLVVHEMEDRVSVLENAGPPRGHWLAVRLIGTRSNRAAIGAVVELRAGGKSQRRRILGSSGYASHSELVARFGLGTSLAVESLRVTWPVGDTEAFEVAGIDRVVTLTEGEGREGP